MKRRRRWSYTRRYGGTTSSGRDDKRDCPQAGGTPPDGGQALADAQPQEWNFSHEHRHWPPPPLAATKKEAKEPAQGAAPSQARTNEERSGARPPGAAQRLASTKKLAGTLHNAASSDPNLSGSFRPTLKAVKAGSKNW